MRAFVPRYHPGVPTRSFVRTATRRLSRRAPLLTVSALVTVLALPAAAQAPPARDRAFWLSLARNGFVVPDGQRAVDLLLEMNALLTLPDPVLRDEVAYSAAERWILRDKRLSPADLRLLIDRWSRNLEVGLGETDTDRVFGRSFSALCLSVAAAADLGAPYLDAPEVERLFARLLDYFVRERDVRGFDAARGWMHSVAHTADALKFLARNSKLPAGADVRLLEAVRTKIDASTLVFAWGDNDRVALALHSAVRRADADGAALEAWAGGWVAAHTALWSRGPQVDPVAFARVENAKQVMRSLHAALSMEAQPTATGAAAATVVLAALAKMR